MNTFALEIRRSKLEHYRIANILIDDIPLADLLFHKEIANAVKIKLPRLAGCYEGLPSIIVLERTAHFMGNTIPEYVYEDNRIALLEYAGSGIPGDYTIACHIDVQQEVIIWNRFRNFSSLFATEEWKYGLSFCFDREQYSEAIADALTSIN